jgi:hypothetical protein
VAGGSHIFPTSHSPSLLTPTQPFRTKLDTVSSSRHSSTITTRGGPQITTSRAIQPPHPLHSTRLPQVVRSSWLSLRRTSSRNSVQIPILRLPSFRPFPGRPPSRFPRSEAVTRTRLRPQRTLWELHLRSRPMTATEGEAPTNQTTVSPALPTSPLSVRSNVDSESGAYGPDAERSDDGLYSISNPVSQWEGSTAAGSSDLEQTNEYWRSRTIPGGADHWRRRIPPDRQRLAVEPVGYPLASLGPTTSMTDDLDRIRHWSTSGAPIDIARKMWADRWGILQTAGHAAALTAHLSMLYDYLFSSAANEPSRLASILNPWVETTAQACNLESLRFLENSLATFPGGNLGIFAAVTTIPPLVDWALRRMQDQPTECRTAIDDCTCGSSTCPL